MKRINLFDKTKSDVWYEIITFPDGEKHVKLEDIDRKESYNIVTRIKSGDDLFILAQVGDILNRAEVYFNITIYYLMSMRMDRVMNWNESFSLKVVANIINSINAPAVQIFHPHSDNVFRYINNSHAFDVGVIDTLSPYKIIVDRYNINETAFCFPDAGAEKRYGKEQHNRIVLSKKRDYENKGAIIGMEVVGTNGNLFNNGTFTGKNILIQDDLCDGGRTFIEAAKLLKEKYNPERIGIFVRHLVNNVGLANLAMNFDDVYITNSYYDWKWYITTAQKYDNVHVIDVIH